MAHTWQHDVDGPSWLPVERILWAPTNSAHGNHLHVVGLPRMGQDELPTNGVWTPAIGEIVDALDAEFGAGEHFIIDPDAAWTHMGVFNPRYIGGTTTWSQHAGANAIDIGPYYGEEEQRIFFDFLTKEDDMVRRSDKADEGQDNLADNFAAQVAKGIMSEYTQPGGVAFNDEVATFNERFEDYILGEVKKLIAQESTTDSYARTLARKALNKLAAIKEAI